MKQMRKSRDVTYFKLRCHIPYHAQGQCIQFFRSIQGKHPSTQDFFMQYLCLGSISLAMSLLLSFNKHFLTCCEGPASNEAASVDICSFFNINIRKMIFTSSLFTYRSSYARKGRG